MIPIDLILEMPSNGARTCQPLWMTLSVEKNLAQKNRGHDDVIKWKHFPRYWPFVWGIHRSPVNSPHKGQWRGVLMFSLICAWINVRVNRGEAGDSRRHRAQLWRQCKNKELHQWNYIHMVNLMFLVVRASAGKLVTTFIRHIHIPKMDTTVTDLIYSNRWQCNTTPTLLLYLL